MLPRRSAVVKYAFGVCVFFSVFMLWITSPNPKDGISTWQHLVEEFEMIGINETLLRSEFEKLKVQVNATYTTENKTLEEVYRYVQAMKRKLPVNPHNFRYILNPSHICRNKEIFLLSYIHSAPDHYKRRMAIRETWGNVKNFPHLQFRLVFLMGKPKDKSIQEALHLESDMYADIVQEDFIDSYRNLTYKAIMGLKWITLHCSHARYILKTDDDIFVNIFNLMNHLQSLFKFQHHEARQLLLCLVWYRMKVIRDPKSKWYIPRDEFPDDFFPTYCSGSAYVMSTDVVVDMYNISMMTQFFWVDDFYITGLLAKKLQIHHQKFNSVYVLGPSVFLEKFTEVNRWRTLVFGHVHSLNAMTHVWKQILDDRKIQTKS